jgi:hypothetical protein
MQVTPRFECREIGNREVVPRTEYPNFRDHGMTVDVALLRLCTNLQKKYPLGGFASERQHRKMLCEDTGHMPGKDTIPMALKRLAAQGLVVHMWLVKGQIGPDGAPLKYGTRIVYVPKTDRQRRSAQRFNATLPERRIYRNRQSGFDVRTLTAKLGAADRPGMPPVPAVDRQPGAAPGHERPVVDYRARAREELERARLECPELFNDETIPKGRAPPD